MEDVVEDMKRDIRISQVSTTSGNRNVSAFTISFSYDNRIMAQKVTADLVSRFMSENTRDRTTQSVLTTQFLRDQLESAKKDLDGIEDKITKFRTANYGRLPEQMGNNQILLGSAEGHIANLNGAISRIGQEKMMLETELRAANAQLAIIMPSPEQAAAAAANNKSERMQQLERDILNSENGLAALKERYKDNHPDVRSVEAQIARLKKQRDKLAKEEADAAVETAKNAKTTPVAKRQDPNFVREKQNAESNIPPIQTQILLNDN